MYKWDNQIGYVYVCEPRHLSYYLFQCAHIIKYKHVRIDVDIPELFHSPLLRGMRVSGCVAIGKLMRFFSCASSVLCLPFSISIVLPQHFCHPNSGETDFFLVRQERMKNCWEHTLGHLFGICLAKHCHRSRFICIEFWSKQTKTPRNR